MTRFLSTWYRHYRSLRRTRREAEGLPPFRERWVAFRRGVGELCGVWVFPFLGLLLWIALVTEYTRFSAGDALLVVLVFSVWSLGRHLTSLREASARNEALLVRIALQDLPAGTLTMSGKPDGPYMTAYRRPDAPEPPRPPSQS